MKILQLVTVRQYRGAEVFASNLSSELISRGIEVIFAGLYAPPKNSLVVEGAVNIDLSREKQSVFSFKVLSSLRRLFAKHQPAIIQANGSDTLKYAVLLKVLFYPNLKIVYRNISIISTWIGESKIKLYFYKLLFSKVDFVTSVGNTAVKDLIYTLNYPENNTAVIRRGSPIERIDATNAKSKLLSNFPITDSDFLLVHVGNFSKEKNHIFLVELLHILKSRDKNIKLLLIGTGDLFDDIKAKVFNNEMGDTIFFAGFRRDVQNLLAGADLFILTSKIEGVPGVILEAGAQKVPAICSNVGGVSEVVQNNITGILMEDFNIDQWVEKILMLKQNTELRNTLGQNAYDHVLTHYDPSKNVNEFIKLYKKIAE